MQIANMEQINHFLQPLEDVQGLLSSEVQPEPLQIW